MGKSGNGRWGIFPGEYGNRVFSPGARPTGIPGWQGMQRGGRAQGFFQFLAVQPTPPIVSVIFIELCFTATRGRPVASMFCGRFASLEQSVS